MKVLEERQDELISLNESKDEWQKKIDEDVSKIVQLKANLSEGTENMEQLEHLIYEMSIENNNQIALKEKLIELIPEIVKTSAKGKPTPEMLAIIKSLP